MGAKLLKWIIFTVLVSLVPFAMIALCLWSDAKSFVLSDLWPKGELLLVSTAIAADAVGEMIGVTKKPQPLATAYFGTATKQTQGWLERNVWWAKIVAAGSCVLALFLSALWYSQIQDHPSYKPSRISDGSIVLFLVTIAASWGCKALAEA